ncbi:hypothetical protein [Ichthyenterobacterium magnum]|uniref:Uncharacterized protein n=1 Tax=Ichthyenterobacterium magnum TaxID=1230530 RepID=A0A420DWD6_9FLAO|nr:hypothetical protein [Ichthyenterobacterium magnum]RKE98536.1 hypothetical protein BXY80_0625 [Ichthyenterobacterium magnum]
MTKKLKSKLWLVALIVGVSIFIFNCQRDEISIVQKEELNYRTVSVKQAKQVFFKKKTKPLNLIFRTSESNELVLSPQWETVEQNELNFTDALMTEVNTLINREGNYSSKAIFIEVNDVVVFALETQYAFGRYTNGDLKEGLVYYNDFDGNFLDAYKIQNGLTTKRFVLNNITQQSGFFLTMFFQNFGDHNCWNTDNLPDDNQLEEVVVTAPAQHSNNSFQEIFIYNYHIPTSGNDISSGSSGSGGFGGGNNSSIINSQLTDLLGQGDSFINTNFGDTNSPYSFDSVADFEEFLDDFENTFELEEINLENLQNGTKITKFKAKFAYIIPPVYLNVHAKSILDNSITENINEFDLLEVISFESGVTPFLEWEQDSYEHSINENIVTVIGHFNIGISIQGFDISYSDSYVITITYNKTTGEPIDITAIGDN